MPPKVLNAVVLRFGVEIGVEIEVTMGAYDVVPRFLLASVQVC